MTPHPDQQLIRTSCAVVTLSDTRTPETDRSGQIIQELLSQAGHRIEDYQILKDEPQQILDYIQQLVQREQLQVIICHGGTGIAPRDTTYDVLAQVLDKTLPGFGELFRWLSYQEIGSRAMASRAIAGLYKNKLLFSLPGSSNAVRLAMEKLILPELPHLLKQITGAT